MKRIGLVLTSLILVLLLTGCGSEKKLECIMSQDLDDVETSQNYIWNFNNKDKYESALLKVEMKLGEEQAKNLSAYKEQMKETYAGEEFKGLHLEVSDNGKDTIIITVNLTSDEVSSMAGEDASKVSYKDIKESMEKQGYTCK